MAPFNAEDSTTRLNLNLEVLDTDLQEYFRTLDERMLIELATKPGLSKKPMSKESMTLMSRVSLPPNGKYEPIIRAKVDIGDGARRVWTWSKDGEPLELPSDWKGLKFTVRLEVRGVWLSSYMLGLSLDATDVMICESNEEASCPFHF